MSTLGCAIVSMGLLICQPGDVKVKAYVAGAPPDWMFKPVRVVRPEEKPALFRRYFSKLHKDSWKNLTDGSFEAAMTAKYGPRRLILIDWSKVKGYRPVASASKSEAD